MTVMEQSAIELEQATRATLNRWKETPGQENYAETNVKWALAYALYQDNYQGFTSRNGSRDMAKKAEKEGLQYALFSNMIQLDSYRKEHSGESLGALTDSFTLMVVDNCRRNDIATLEELLQVGVEEMMRLHNGGQQQEVNLQDSLNEVAYQFANNVLDCYVWYNASYQIVSAANQGLDASVVENLDTYCRTQQVVRQQQEKQM